MVAGQLRIDPFVEFTVTGSASVEGLEPTIILRQLLLYDVCLNGHPQMIRLTGEVGRDVVVLVFFERVVAKITPQHSRHAHFMRLRETLRYPDDLTSALFRPKIDCRAHSRRAHVGGLLDGTEHDLIKLVWVSEQLVMINLHE